VVGLALAGLAGAGLSLRVARVARAAEEPKVNWYNWDTYIAPTTLEDVSAMTGLEIQYDLYANNEELLSKVREGNPGYDLFIPSDYMVETMIALGILQELDHSKIPNIEHLEKDDNFRNPAFNPGLKFGVPYFYGSVGIGYRKSAVPEAPTSWGALFENDAYKGRVALLADQRYVLGAALKYLGYPANSVNEAEIAAARDLLIRAKPNLKAFAPDSGQDMLLSGEIDLVMEWNGDILSVIAEDPDLAYAIPDEGTLLWMDSLCIPKDAPHPNNAHAVINAVHDPKINADIANYIKYATSNASAKAMISEADLNDPAIYPTPAVLAKSESLIDVGEATTLYDKAWTEVMAA
jgi:spermidine/putrescine transport system substrate-binding protein